MHKKFIAAGAIFGGLAVALGAFGAHGLESITTDEKILHGYQTGVHYQLYHALALLVIAGIADKVITLYARWASFCFIAGIILFSGSLYLLTFLKIQSSGLVKIVGPITPAGGLFFMAGWLFLLMAAIKKK